MKSLVVGIDLGTTNSAIAHLDANGVPSTITNREGELTTPSVILFESATDVVVGTQAKRAALVEPAKVAEGVKRYIGDQFYPKLLLDQKFSPQALSAMILKKLKQDVESKVGPIAGAVITVPAYFDESRRQATVQAGQIAGLKVIDIINEPTAAALAYAFGQFSSNPKTPAPPTRTVVVYDLGGGTLDVTVLKIEGKNLTVLATAGDVHLGGRDWDERLYNHLADAFVKEHGLDPRDDKLVSQNLLQQAEEMKKDLSRRQKVPFIINHGGKTLRGQLERAEFEKLTADLLFRTESRLTRVMRDAGMAWEQIDQVLLVGGSTRMPQVVEMLKRVTGKEPNISLSPDEVVAHGAAIYAAMRLAGAVPTQTTVVTPAGDAKNADELPAIEDVPGLLSRIAAPVLQLLRSIKATNVCAHSLGVVVEDAKGQSHVSRLIARNTKLPVTTSKVYATVNADQRRVSVRVVEGESKDPAECIAIGACSVENLPPGLPKGSPIEVQFHYDRSGRLDVKAVHVTSGTWAKTRIERNSGVDPSLIKISKEVLDRLAIT